MSYGWLLLAPLFGGAFFDLLLGDPEWFALHPVRLIGRLIGRLDRALYRETDSDKRKLCKGAMLVIFVLLLTGLFATALFYVTFLLATWLHPAVGLLWLSLVTATTLAAGSLRKESMRVYDALPQGISAARHAVSRIVGRDTERLDTTGVIKATVETIAENTVDGVTAPYFYLMLGGMPLALLYKAANTMDSMLGYRNDRYLYFGRAAARLDDVLNMVPARLTALLMCLAAPFCGLDGRNAFCIWRRDRRKHDSPNAAQTESACAGALHVELAGDAYYFGKKKEKPTIGDPDRPVTPEDIRRANRLMLVTSVLMFLLAVLGRAGLACLLIFAGA